MPRTTHKVAWTESAALDLDAIVRFIATDAPLNALKVLSKIRGATDGLVRFPERGRVVPELAENGIVAYRELVVRPYRIVYRMHGRDVYILTVIDGRRDVEDLLLERLTCRPPESRPDDVVTKRDRRKKK